MTEQELLRTALILPPRARAVLCVWAAIPGLLCAPFVFWQNLFAGLCFCAVWGLLVLALRLRACSFVYGVRVPGGIEPVCYQFAQWAVDDFRSQAESVCENLTDGSEITTASRSGSYAGSPKHSALYTCAKGISTNVSAHLNS